MQAARIAKGDHSIAGNSITRRRSLPERRAHQAVAGLDRTHGGIPDSFPNFYRGPHSFFAHFGRPLSYCMVKGDKREFPIKASPTSLHGERLR